MGFMEPLVRWFVEQLGMRGTQVTVHPQVAQRYATEAGWMLIESPLEGWIL